MSSKLRTRRDRYPLSNGVLMTPVEMMELGVHA